MLGGMTAAGLVVSGAKCRVTYTLAQRGRSSPDAREARARRSAEPSPWVRACRRFSSRTRRISSALCRAPVSHPRSGPLPPLEDPATLSLRRRGPCHRPLPRSRQSATRISQQWFAAFGIEPPHQFTVKEYAGNIGSIVTERRQITCNRPNKRLLRDRVPVRRSQPCPHCRPGRDASVPDPNSRFPTSLQT